MADGLRIARLDQDLDGAILHLDFRIAQQRAQALDLHRPILAGKRGQGRGANEFIGVVDLRMQRDAHIGAIEAAKYRQDLQPRHGVFALQTSQQLRHAGRIDHLTDNAKQRAFFVGLLGIGGAQQLTDAEARTLGVDDFEHCRFRDAGLGERLEQQVRWKAAAAGERPGNPGDHPWTARDQRFNEARKTLDRRQR